MSHCWVGSTHDLTMLKLEFPSQQDWFKPFRVLLDLGYVGFESAYACRQAILPKKKTKNKPLSRSQKYRNKKKSQEGILVEHSLAGLKRYRILNDRVRSKNFRLYDDILEICSGLWNFYLLC